MVQRGKIFQVLARGQLPVNTAFTGQHRAQILPHLAGLLDDVETVHPRGSAGRLEQVHTCGWWWIFPRRWGRQPKDLTLPDL